jgi:hypothetical protein
MVITKRRTADPLAKGAALPVAPRQGAVEGVQRTPDQLLAALVNVTSNGRINDSEALRLLTEIEQRRTEITEPVFIGHLRTLRDGQRPVNDAVREKAGAILDALAW